jgi:hypothetical protein
VSGKLTAPTATPPNTDSVTVSINGTSVSQSVSLSGGAFTVTLSTAGIPASASAYPISYSFAGDSNFNTASDASTSLTVQKATPVFNNLTASQTVPYGTATITVSGKLTAPTATPPNTDSVTVSINGTSVSQSVSLSGGAFTATLSTAAIPASVSAYTITYSYNTNYADTNFKSATDASTTLTVNKANTTSTVSISPISVVFGSSGLLTLSAKVIASSPSTATVNEGTIMFTIANSGGTVATLSPNPVSNGTASTTYPVNNLLAGSYTVVATFAATGNFNGSGSSLASLTVSPASPSLAAMPSSVQYSDLATLTATVSPVALNGQMASGVVTFTINAINGVSYGPGAVNTMGIASATTGQILLAPGQYTIAATFTSTNPNFFGATATSTLTVTQEDARVTYAGNLFYGIPQTSQTGLITLVATISDITALCDPSNVPVGFSNCAAWAAAQNPLVPWDPNVGDIRNATVTFVDRSTNMTLCTAPVLLINSSDTKTGSVTCGFTGTVGSTGSTQYTVGIVVNGYYSRNMSTDNALVTISQVGPGMITGGGYLMMKNSAGTIAGDPGTHNNFGFNVQYKSSAQNPHGNINSIVRRMEKDGIQHVYQIKGNSMNTLAVYQLVGATLSNGTLTGGTWNAGCTGATSTSPCRAQFNGNANIQDITNPLSPVSVTGNNSLQFNMTDYGTPGSGDTLGVTLWNSSGGIWFSTNWVGTPPSTVEQLLGGGNLVVH